MRGYSIDIRERVVKAIAEEGQSIQEVAKRYSISRWTVSRYVKRARGGNLAESSREGQKLRLGAEGFKVLKEQVEKHPDWTLEQRAKALSESQGESFKKSVIGKYLKVMRITVKKRCITPKSEMNKLA